MDQATLDLQNTYSNTVDALQNGETFGALNVSNYGVPPWEVPPLGFDSFDEVGVTGLGLVTTTVTMLSFLVPYGYDGVIKRFYVNYLGTAFVDGSGDIVWRILADSRPIKNFGNIIVQMGSATIPRLTDGIRIYAGQTISIVAYHANNVNLTDQVTGSLAGYYYPRVGN